MAKRISDARELIDFLGGSRIVADMIGENRTTVSNWRTRGLPPDTFLVFQSILKKKDVAAPAALWGMKRAG